MALSLSTFRSAFSFVLKLQFVLSIYLCVATTFWQKFGYVDGESIHEVASNSSRLGIRNFDEPSPRIINGVKVSPTRYPYVAMLNEANELMCGGVLIAPDIILTAAHCSESFHEVQIGRYNRSDDTEEYESFIVERIMTHPRYYRNRFLDSDPHDVAVVKLYGQSKITPPISINRDPRIPISDEEMSVFGWGSTDPTNLAEQSEVLLGANVFYMPNEECKTFIGDYGDHEVNFERYVIDATICAMNFDDLSDSCKGDSGSGLIVTGREPEEDVLVGIVSAGFGCANPDLPALYARISEVYGWIREQTCEFSDSPPIDFECPKMDRLPGISSCNDQSIEQERTWCMENDTEVTQISIQIFFDSRPEELGWILRRKNEWGAWVTDAERPILSYRQLEPMSVTHETVSVRNNQYYEFVLLDSYGDLYQSAAHIASEVILEVRDEEGSVLVSISKSTMDPKTKYTASFPFTVGESPSNAPSKSTAPSMSMVPTATPTKARPFITIVINFDQNPENIGFELEKLGYNPMEVKSEIGTMDQIDELVYAVYPGTYTSESANMTSTQIIYLMPPKQEAEFYRFIMTSNEGRGFRSGGYEVWFGDPSFGELLFTGDDFYLEDRTIFGIVPKSTMNPSLSPTRGEPQTSQPTSLPISSPLEPGASAQPAAIHGGLNLEKEDTIPLETSKINDDHSASQTLMGTMSLVFISVLVTSVAL